MTKVGTLVLCAVASVSIASWDVKAVHAFPPFKKEFDNLYIKENPATLQEKSLKEAVGFAKCGVCHTGPEGKNKKVRNTYGKAISKLIPERMNKEAMELREEESREDQGDPGKCGQGAERSERCKFTDLRRLDQKG